MKIGIGFDIHRLAKGRKLFLGGIEIPHSSGLLGHSDADVVLHAIADAIAGAMAAPDIGTVFPDTDPSNRGIAGNTILAYYVALMKKRKTRISHLDMVIIAEAPKLSPHYPAIRKNIARLLGVGLQDVGLKAKTLESIGEIGKKKAIACWASVLLETVSKSRRKRET
jgi:2-C-methyl-D-erythritol 2,4-cyclodiphosphate synthase